MTPSRFLLNLSPWRALSLACLLLVGCSGTPDRPKPAELTPNVALLGVRQVWTARIGAVSLPLQLAVAGSRFAVASDDGAVVMLDGRTGADVWRMSIGARIAAGVGTDGEVAAVVTRDNDLVAMAGGRELWRQRLAAQSFTAPLVAGARVFVLTADRAVAAYDARTGRRLWNRQRPGEPLVLRQAGVMLAVGDQLVAGLSGRLVGMNPNTGAIAWEVPIASPRGANDLDRLVDLVGRASRIGNVVCARAYQANVGCVDAARGTLLWTRVANGAEGVHGDNEFVVGAETDGRIVALRRSSGERAWSSDRLRYRNLTAPLVAGRSVAFGDGTGLVHLLSRADGSPLNRLSTDGSAIVAAPTLAGQTMVVVTRNGGVFGFAPE
jgi:outer membrane protein assembly factor BamB